MRIRKRRHFVIKKYAIVFWAFLCFALSFANATAVFSEALDSEEQLVEEIENRGEESRLIDFLGTYLCEATPQDLEDYPFANPDLISLYINPDNKLELYTGMRFGTTGTSYYYPYDNYKIEGNSLSCNYVEKYSCYGLVDDEQAGTHIFNLDDNGNIIKDGFTWYKDKDIPEITELDRIDLGNDGDTVSLQPDDFSEGTQGDKEGGIPNEDIQITFQSYYQDSKEYAVIIGNGKNGEVYWEYHSEGYSAAQCSYFTEIGLFNDLYYFCESGSIITLNPLTGDVEWKNDSGCGSPASGAFDFDENGNLYVSGSLSPDLLVVSDTGETLMDINVLNKDYYWPYIVKYLGNGNLSITYEGCTNSDEWKEDGIVVQYSLEELEKTAKPEDPSINTMTPIDNSVILEVRQSSALSEYGMTHDSSRVVDHDLTTAWVEGVSGVGVGEKLTFVFDGKQEIAGMIINAGYQKTEELYYKNARPSSINIMFSDGSSDSFQLQDYFGSQNISFKERKETDILTVSIESVYYGSKYEDTVISEIRFYK